MELCLVVGACKEGLEFPLPFPRESIPEAFVGNVISILKPLLLSPLCLPPQTLQCFPIWSQIMSKVSLMVPGPHPMSAAGLFQLSLTGSNEEDQPSSLVAQNIGTPHVLPSPQKLPLSFCPALTVTAFRLDVSSSKTQGDSTPFSSGPSAGLISLHTSHHHHPKSFVDLSAVFADEIVKLCN